LYRFEVDLVGFYIVFIIMLSVDNSGMYRKISDIELDGFSGFMDGMENII
jgi:hypothetical protein